MTLKTQIPKSEQDTRALICDNYQIILVNFSSVIACDLSVKPSHRYSNDGHSLCFDGEIRLKYPVIIIR